MIRSFLDANFLLRTDTAVELFRRHAEKSPIADYHTLLRADLIAANEPVADLTTLWLDADPAKWRLMRAGGVSEDYISGNRTPYEKFEKWAEILPQAMRHPIYHQAHMELNRVFGIGETLKPSNARDIYESCTAKLQTLTAHGEASVRGRWGSLAHMMTVGAEWAHQKFSDPNSMSQAATEGGRVPGIAVRERSSEISARIASVFVEDNIELTRATLITPGLRLDHHSKAGGNVSPSLNLSHYFTDRLTLKAGVARAYKAPNLYQLNPNYLLYSRGLGCWGGHGSCYLQGNPDLKAETSINKELGIEYTDDTVQAGATLFHNDYRNKIEAGHDIVGNATGGTGPYANSEIFRWSNTPKAVISGLEGTFSYRFSPALTWRNNFTWMLQSKNKLTDEQLSIIPKYTLNSRLDYKALPALDVFAAVTFYGRQKPNKYDYQGLPLTGEETRSLKPYGLVNVGGQYAFTPDIALSFGINNLFDKRLYRMGNAIGVNRPRTIYGAGAATYNEPGRSFYVGLSARF